MLPGDRLVCAFVKTQTVGTQFRQWPLHVTIVPWFRADEPSEALARSLRRSLKNIEPFVAIAGGEALFGARKSKPVRLLRPVQSFKLLEQAVRACLHQKRAWLVDETTKTRRDFVPHVTDQAASRLAEGDRFWCTQLYIVEQKGNYKEIVSEIYFD